MEDDIMQTWIKAVLTAICAMALAWPLLFWGKPALPESRDVYFGRQPPPAFNLMQQHEHLW
jgi:hypothetical protein